MPKTPFYKTVPYGEHVDGFRAHLAARGYGSSSVQGLPRMVADFFIFIGKTAEGVAREDIESFMLHLSQRPNQRRGGGLSSSYIGQHLYALDLFFCSLVRDGRLPAAPTGGVSWDRGERQKRTPLTRTEIALLYENCNDPCDRALLAAFYGCGLRRSEGAALDTGDIDLRGRLLYVRSGKGGRRRAVPMGEKVAEDMRGYMGRGRKGALFAGRGGGRLTGGALNARLGRMARRAGIERPCSLHVLRHSIATHLLLGGMPAERVRDFLGHRHMESTQAYTHIKDGDLWGISTI